MAMARRPELTSIAGKAADLEEVAEAAEEEEEVEWEAVLDPVTEDTAELTDDLDGEDINEECATAELLYQVTYLTLAAAPVAPMAAEDAAADTLLTALVTATTAPVAIPVLGDIIIADEDAEEGTTALGVRMERQQLLQNTLDTS